MKNVIKLFAFILTFALCSCGGQTPKDVAEEAMTCLQNGDFKAYVDLMEPKTSESPEKIEKDKATLVALLEGKASKSIEKKGGIKDFEVIKETIDKKNGTATIKMEVEYNNGSTDDTNIRLKKGDDGKWYLRY